MNLIVINQFTVKSSELNKPKTLYTPSSDLRGSRVVVRVSSDEQCNIHLAIKRNRYSDNLVDLFDVVNGTLVNKTFHSESFLMDQQDELVLLNTNSDVVIRLEAVETIGGIL